MLITEVLDTVGPAQQTPFASVPTSTVPVVLRIEFQIAMVQCEGITTTALLHP